MSEHEKQNNLHRAPGGLHIREQIMDLDNGMQLVLFGVVGLLLIAFPETLAPAIPYLLGLALALYGFVSLIHCIAVRDETAMPGFDAIYIVLGAAILWHRENALGAIGSIWGMFTLIEVAEEANEAYHIRKFSPIRLLIALVSTALAVMLMFDPFEHFAFHVRILGIEMILSVLVRWGMSKKRPVKRKMLMKEPDFDAVHLREGKTIPELERLKARLEAEAAAAAGTQAAGKTAAESAQAAEGTAAENTQAADRTAAEDAGPAVEAGADRLEPAGREEEQQAG